MTSSESLPSLGAVILAGGKATRFSGKCFAPLNGKELILHVFERTSTVASKIVLVGKSAQDISLLRELLPDAEIVRDESPEQNPLVGLLSGLHAIQNLYVFVAACDTPFLEPRIIRSLASAAIGRDGAVPYSNGEFEPLCAVYNRASTIQSATECLRSSNPSMNSMLRGLKDLVRIDKEDLRRYDPHLLSFFNINTQADLTTASETKTTP